MAASPFSTAYELAVAQWLSANLPQAPAIVEDCEAIDADIQAKNWSQLGADIKSLYDLMLPIIGGFPIPASVPAGLDGEAASAISAALSAAGIMPTSINWAAIVQAIELLLPVIQQILSKQGS